MKTFFALTTGFLGGFIFCAVCIATAEKKEEDEARVKELKKEIDKHVESINRRLDDGEV